MANVQDQNRNFAAEQRRLRQEIDRLRDTEATMKEHLENQAQQWELDAVNVPFQWAVDMFLFLETRDERLEKGLELLESKVSGQLVDVNARLGGIEARQLELMTIVKDINGKLDKLLSNN